MTDIVDNLESLAHASDAMGKHASAKIIRQGIAEIEALRRRLELQREKLPSLQGRLRITTFGSIDGCMICGDGVRYGLEGRDAWLCRCGRTALPARRRRPEPDWRNLPEAP